MPMSTPRSARVGTGPFAATIFLVATLATPDDARAQTDEDRIARAVMPAPAPMRAGATVLGQGLEGVVRLREGEGPMICLADDPGEEGFHVSCYHESLEPYMARGRELRAEGVSGRDAIARRWEEIEAGELAFPDRAALYSLSGDDPAGELQALTVVYLKGASAATLGVPENPRDGIPWLMFSGRPTAHLMIHDPMPRP